MRATRSVARLLRASSWAQALSSSSPAVWPPRVVDLLEPVDVEDRDRGGRPAAGAVELLAPQRLVPGRAAGDAGQRVGADAVGEHRVLLRQLLLHERAPDHDLRCLRDRAGHALVEHREAARQRVGVNHDHHGDAARCRSGARGSRWPRARGTPAGPSRRPARPATRNGSSTSPTANGITDLVDRVVLSRRPAAVGEPEARAPTPRRRRRSPRTRTTGRPRRCRRRATACPRARRRRCS